MEIENKPLFEVMRNQDEFDFYINLAKYIYPKNVFDLKPVQEMRWGLIKETQYMLSKSDLSDEQFKYIFENFTEKKIDEIAKIGVIDFFQQMKWIVEEIRIITEKEQTVLSNELSPEQMEAGFEELNRFGYKATLHALAGKDILKHKEIENLPYQDVFLVLYLEKVSNDIDKKLNKIRMRR